MLILAWGLAVALALPMIWFALECLVPAWRTVAASAQTPPIAVLIPAHDEEASIARVVADVRAGLRPCDRLLVVADNCTDMTAECARLAGAEVIERVDPARRGKPYALAHGRDWLRRAPPTVVVVVDADCAPARDAVLRIASVAAADGAAVQGCYLLQPEAGAGTRARVSAFAFLIKNLVRQVGLQAIAGRCLLQGSGMAFPWPMFDRAELANGSLVEDLKLGLELALAGERLRFVADARFLSPTSPPVGARCQRTRWEQGMILTALHFLPRLALRGLARPSLLALAANLVVPPISLLCLLAAGGLPPVVLLCLWLEDAGPALFAAAGLLALAAGIAVAWHRHGRALLRPAMLAALPGYALAKLPIYAALPFRRQRSWVRTPRAIGPR